MLDLENSRVMEEIEELSQRKRWHDIRDMLLPFEPADIAAILAEMQSDRLPLLYRLLPKELAAEAFVEMDPEEQELLIRTFSDAELKEVLDELYVDDTVDLIEEMPASVVKRILRHTDPETRRSVNEILKYPEDSAGSIMTTEFVDLKRDMTVEDAIKRIRRTGVDKETINICYVTDTSRHLLGLVSIRTLLLAEQDDVIEDIMETNVVAASTMDDREDVAQDLSKYDFLAMPIVDDERRLVGIVTIDDAIDVIEEEATEDFEHIAGMTHSDKPYLRAGVWETVKSRIPWLLLLMLSATFTGMVIASFEDALAACSVLTVFIPMLMDTGGNSGNQSSVALIRSLSLDEVHFSDLFAVLWKEIRVAVTCGAILAACNFAKLMLVDRLLLQNADITMPVAAVICLTLVFTVFCAKIVGCLMPMISDRLKLDPAVVAGPFITTIVDVLSLLIYFRFASWVLGIQA
jgi:magnesium transporter